MLLHNIIIIVFLFLFPPFTQANSKNSTQNGNKSKRFLANQMGEAKAVLFYMENPQQNGGEIPELQTASSSIRNLYSAPGKPLAVVSVQQPVQVFEQDQVPKQVAEQQVFYEFQQTPNNAVSNVQVKQLFQPDGNNHQFYGNFNGEQLPLRSQPQATGSHYHPAATTIISPSSNQYNNNNPSFNDYSTIKQQQPSKSIYLNGKIVYNPVAHHPIFQQSKFLPPNSVYNRGVYHNQQKLPLINNNGQFLQQNPEINNYRNNNGVGRGQVTSQTQDNRAPNSYLPPITKNNRFRAPKQLQQINKPSVPVYQPQEEEDEENSEDDDVEEEESDAQDEEDDDVNDDDDDSYGYETFQFEDEYRDNDYGPKKSKRQREKDDEYEEERDRKYPKNHSRRYRNQPKYESNNFYKNPKITTKNKPINGKFKKVKFSKSKGGKPKFETIEGRFSEQIPVTHRQKLYKERWYVTQDLDGAKNKT